MDTASAYDTNVQVFESAGRMFQRAADLERQAQELRQQATALRDSARCPVEERIYRAYQDVGWEHCQLPAGHPEPCKFL